MKNMKKIFLCDTIWPRVLIFGMQHHLVDLYQVCSNYVPGTKNGPVRGVGGVTGFTLAYIVINMKKNLV